MSDTYMDRCFTRNFYFPLYPSNHPVFPFAPPYLPCSVCSSSTRHGVFVERNIEHVQKRELRDATISFVQGKICILEQFRRQTVHGPPNIIPLVIDAASFSIIRSANGDAEMRRIDLSSVERGQCPIIRYKTISRLGNSTLNCASFH